MPLPALENRYQIILEFAPSMQGHLYINTFLLSFLEIILSVCMLVMLYERVMGMVWKKFFDKPAQVFSYPIGDIYRPGAYPAARFL